MAKGDDKERYTTAQDNARTQTGNIQQGYGQFTGDIAGRMPTDRARADEERAYLTQQYRNIAEGSGRDYLRSITGGPPFLEGNHPGGPGSGSSSSGSGGGGGYSPSDPYGSVRGGFGDFASTGGVNYGRMTEALGGFRDIASTGGFTDENRRNLADISRGYSNLYDRPFDRSDIDSSIGTLRGASVSGGFDPNRRAGLDRDIDSLRNFESISPERMAEFRANQNRLTNLDTSNAQIDIDRLRSLDPQFEEWSRTGGYSDQDQRNIRARAGSTLPSFYSGVKDEMARRNAVSGGFSPGYSAGMRALTRDSARGAAEANRNAEIDLQSQIRLGRQYGLTGRANNAATTGGLSGALLDQQRQALESGTRLGQDLDLAVAGNRLRGIEGALEASSRLESEAAANRIRSAESGGNLALNTGNAEANARLSALTGRRQTELDPISIANDARLRSLTGITDTAQGAERTVQSGRQFGLSGLMGIAQAEEAARQAAASRASAESMASQGYDLQRAQLASQNERFAMELGLNGLGGLSDLYRSAPGEVGMYNDDYLGGLSGWNDSVGTGVLAQSPMPKQGGFNWSSMLSSGLGALSKIKWGNADPGDNQNQTGPAWGSNSAYGDWAQSHINNPKPPDSYFPGGQFPGGNLPNNGGSLPSSTGIWSPRTNNTGITGGYSWQW